jgi:hypothetical protein
MMKNAFFGEIVNSSAGSLSSTSSAMTLFPRQQGAALPRTICLPRADRPTLMCVNPATKTAGASNYSLGLDLRG